MALYGSFAGPSTQISKYSLGASPIVQISQRYSSAAPAQPKRPSPYRLIPPHTFLAQFAPLHVAGWRLDLLPSVSGAGVPGHRPVEEGMADLQDRRLVRLYEFEPTRQGWKDLMQLTARIGEAVEREDHHPKILISPTQDYTGSTVTPGSPQSGYVLELSTHTHTPLPASASSSGSGPAGSKEKQRPGVTTKDLRLAEAVEDVYREIAGVKVD